MIKKKIKKSIKVKLSLQRQNSWNQIARELQLENDKFKCLTLIFHDMNSTTNKTDECLYFFKNLSQKIITDTNILFSYF